MSRETNENPDESSTPSREKQLFSSYAAGRVTKKSQLLIIPIALKIPLEGKTGGARLRHRYSQQLRAGASHFGA